MLEQIWKFLGSNQFASAGLITVITGAILSYCKSLPFQIKNWFLRNFTNHIIIYSDDLNAYHDFSDWFSEQYKPTFGQHHLKSIISGKPRLDISYGTYWKFIGWTLLIVTKSMEKKENLNRDIINIRLFGTKKKFIEIIDKVYKYKKSKQFNGISIYVGSGSNLWQWVGNKEKIVTCPVLDGTLYNEILDDCQTFIKNKDRYNKRGINHKRVFLFYGPPGNGKTSTIISLATELKKDIYCINISKETENTQLINSICNCSQGILLIEDVDCISELSVNRDGKEEKRGIDLSTLLNILDGPYTPSGLICFLTTNKIEKLDEALLRKGRVDVKVLINGPNKEKILQLYKNLKETEEGFEEFYVKHDFKCMADVQGIILDEERIEI